MKIPLDLSPYSLSLESAILQGQALVMENALPLAGALSLAALASEVLPRIYRLKDPRTKYLAAQLGVDPADIVPIGDGVQLWLDARSHLKTDDPASSCPVGCPTLRASYVVRQEDRLLLLCVHSTEDVIIQPNPDHEGLADAVMPTLDHSTGKVHAADYAVEPETDAILRANLIEAVANTRFGYRGAVSPVILWKDPQGLAPEPEDERSLSGERASQLAFDDAGRISGSLPKRRGQFQKTKGFRRLSRWLRTQPGRATPLSRLAIRSVVVGLGAWAILNDPSFPGHDAALRLLQIGREMTGL